MDISKPAVQSPYLKEDRGVSGQGLSHLLCDVHLAAALNPVRDLVVCKEELGQALLKSLTLLL